MQLKEMKKRSHVPFTQFSPSAKTCKTTVHYHNQDINVETLKTQSISFTMGSLLGPSQGRHLCCDSTKFRDWTKRFRHEEANHRMREVAKPQRGRAPPGRSQVTFSASCLKCKAAGESSSQLTIKVPCGPLSGLAILSL